MNEFLHVLLKIFEMIYQSSGIQIFIAAINTNVTLDHSQPSLVTAGPCWPVAGESLKSVLVSPRCLRSVAPMPATAAAQATLMHPGCSCSGVWPLTTGPGSRAPLAHSAVTTSRAQWAAERLRLAASDWRLQAHFEPASACSTSPGHELWRPQVTADLGWGALGSGGLTTSRTSGMTCHTINTLMYRQIVYQWWLWLSRI